ncbi:hypothetical protein BABINDRAFT_163249 [Babjeviella inositovora NRRL Y-12698]|uniref:Serine/threonine-protein kinase RAD53 n=1 Tax=Babjeviella inositovora NRRL Y-12698 TaxID=984486 RepID=A0A1E3QK90_9ASCO|nr:uncharacterized protein BABINDRAFT_163249 [Babjeviella inositovora NRRL Y-12698]ODQ77874.1 hypothetical protein BABINDRAFT_163249 [Babjeviella inositovora NRRL Y-12698]
MDLSPVEPTQPTQTQPTQLQGLEAPELADPSVVARFLCTTGQLKFLDLQLPSPARETAEWTFGRNAGSDFPLPKGSSRLSNHHFKAWYSLTDRNLMLQDVSTNGTYINNTRMVKGTNYIVNQGDEIAVGVGVPEDVLRFIVVFNPNPVEPPKTRTADEGIHRHYIIRKEIVGQGAFATVKKAIERATGKTYAVKIINKRKVLTTGGTAIVARELAILEKLDHPGIVRLQASYEDADNYYLVIEFVPGGDLMDFVAAHGAVGEEAAREIARQILHAIEYVHALGISHRDLKPDNILIMLDDPVQVKITDFGLAKVSDQNSFMKTFCGTLAYVAPEIVLGKKPARRKGIQPQAQRQHYSSLVDMWSLGCLVFVILTAHLPFSGLTQDDLFKQIKSGVYHQSLLTEHGVSGPGRGFLESLLKVDPMERITATQALQHPWIVNENDSVVSLSQSQSQHKQSQRGEFSKPLVFADGENVFKMPKKIPKENAVEKNQAPKELDVAKNEVGGEMVEGEAKEVSPSEEILGTDRSEAVSIKSNDGGPFPLETDFASIPPQAESTPKAEHGSPNRSPIRSPLRSERFTSKIGPEEDLPRLSAVPGLEPPSFHSLSMATSSRRYSRNGVPGDAPHSTPPGTYLTLQPLSESIPHQPIHILQGMNPFVVGRSDKCNVTITDDRMSKIHCGITKKRHPTGTNTNIFESPAMGLDDVWLIDNSTNSCFINQLRIGKGKKAKIFDGDMIYLFNDKQKHQMLGFRVCINDGTGLFNGGERLDVETEDHMFDASQLPVPVPVKLEEPPKHVVPQDPSDKKVLPVLRFPPETAMVPTAPTSENGEKRRAPEVETRVVKRADLKSDLEKPADAWIH